MKNKNYLYCLGLLIFMSHELSYAGNIPGAVTITAADAFYRFAPNRHLDNSALPNLSLAYNFTPHWAIEGTAGVLNTRYSEEPESYGVHGYLYTINGIYRFMPCGHFEPYILGGIGLLNLMPNGIDSEHPGNLNVGFGAQLFWGPTVAMRAEFRDVYQTTGQSHNDYMINVGVSFLIGGSKIIQYK